MPICFFILALWPMCVSGQRSVTDRLNFALSNIDSVANIIASISFADLQEQPDSVLFDYYYLKAYADDINGNSNAKVADLKKAKDLCESSQGIHTPVYLEVVWAIGGELEATGDTCGAFEIYQSALIQSIGLYSLKDTDVKWQYEEMENKVKQWYGNKNLRKQMVARRYLFKPRKNDKGEETINDKAFYDYIEKDKSAREQTERADSFMTIANYEAAIQIYVKLQENIKDNVVAKATLGELVAINYLNMGDFKKAEIVLLANIANLEDAHLTHTKSLRRSLSNLGLIYSKLHNPEKAKTYCGRAKYLYEHYLDFSNAYILCLMRCASLENEAGNIYTSLLMTDVAIQETSRIINRNISDATCYKAIENLCELLSSDALAYRDFGYDEEAISLVKESIALSESIGHNTASQWFNLATIYLKESKYGDATETSLKAYRLCDVPYDKVEIGTMLLLCEYLSKQPFSADIAVEVSRLLKGQTDEVFSFMSSEERFKYWQHFELYTPLLNWLIYESQDKTLYGHVYNNTIQSKGILLRYSNQLMDAILSSNNEEYIQLYKEWLTYKQQLIIEKEKSSKDELTQKIEQIEKHLAREFLASTEQVQKISWESIRDNLSGDEVAIEFYNIPLIHNDDSIDGDPRYCALLLKHDYDHPHIIPLCTESILEAINEDDLYTTSDIYKMIWQPLADELMGVRRIFFAADRDLHQIAIEYALTDVGKRMNEIYDLRRLSSTREIAKERKATNHQQTILFGGLHYDIDKDGLIAQSRDTNTPYHTASRSVKLDNLRYGVNYLPETLVEIEAISSSLREKGIQCSEVMGDSGTEEVFRGLSGKRINILHLATHGFFWSEEDTRKRNYIPFLNRGTSSLQSEEDNALKRSGLLFSGANYSLKGNELPDDVEDGILTAQEISTLNLDSVDLVVLSACQTGLGMVNGEGVFGLQRGFKLAGVKTLLMSLWKVDDVATRMLMTEFYSHLLSGESKTTALYKAQQYVKLHPDYKDPAYWAGFILLDALN